MRKLTAIAGLVFVLCCFWAFLAIAQDTAEVKKVKVKEVKHEYVGAKRCKMCHQDRYAAWSETGHAMTYGRLSDEEKKKKECVGCHITGTSAKGELLEGVQCEACHGPGKDYSSVKIMNKAKWKANPEAHKKMAIDAGLIYPGEDDCIRCHKKEGNPNFKPFDFAKRKVDVHPVKAKAAK